MGEKYGDRSDCLVCEECGMCKKPCGDCEYDDSEKKWISYTMENGLVIKKEKRRINNV